MIQLKLVRDGNLDKIYVFTETSERERCKTVALL